MSALVMQQAIILRSPSTKFYSNPQPFTFTPLSFKVLFPLLPSVFPNQSCNKYPFQPFQPLVGTRRYVTAPGAWLTLTSANIKSPQIRVLELAF